MSSCNQVVAPTAVKLDYRLMEEADSGSHHHSDDDCGCEADRQIQIRNTQVTQENGKPSEVECAPQRAQYRARYGSSQLPMHDANPRSHSPADQARQRHTNQRPNNYGKPNLPDAEWPGQSFNVAKEPTNQ